MGLIRWTTAPIPMTCLGYAAWKQLWDQVNAAARFEIVSRCGTWHPGYPRSPTCSSAPFRICTTATMRAHDHQHFNQLDISDLEK